ncbi:MAG: hypothetical protein MUP45_02805 [Candidatus Marinimicrobia bacterium]|nr:hypothetical protein [Candidatus Neomarinimicrobiota bacterium]
MEKLRAPFKRLARAIYQPPAPELVELSERIAKGEETRIKMPRKKGIIFDFSGNRLRIRIPWGKGNLEKSLLARVDPKTREVTVRTEGFFRSDKHDWPEKTP